jgi:hypothetical protein
MDYKVKYLKYKEKYLFMKKLKGGSSNQATKIRTQFNSGHREGMSNQCFFISIHDHLLKNGVRITLRELREQGGLDASTEHTMLDSTEERFRKAVERICDIHGLYIGVLPIDNSGNIRYGGDYLDVLGQGNDIIRIAQFGLYHFQRIKEDDEPDEPGSQGSPRSPGSPGSPSDLLAFIDNEFINFNLLSPEAQDAYLRLTELNNELFLLKKANNISQNEWGEILKKKYELMSSKNMYDPSTYSKLLQNYESEQKAKVKKFKTKEITNKEIEIKEIKDILDILIKEK